MGKPLHERIILGGSAVALVVALLAAQFGVEPIATWFYPVAWWSLIIMIDRLVYRRKGESLLTSRARHVALLLGTSVVFWLLFELANVRLQNWYYVNVPASVVARVIGEIVSFATVLPAIFEIADLLEAYGFSAATPPPPVWLSHRGQQVVQGLGVLCLLLPLALPTYCYPLIWIFPFLLLDPFLHRWGLPCLLRDFELGQMRRIKLLLIAGFIAGLLWEALNYQARSHWFYTVPGFAAPYYFRMPWAGLLGFLPFALSSYTFYLFVDALWGNRGWRLDELHEERVFRFSEEQAPSRGAFVFVPAAIAVTILGIVAVDRYNVDSVHPAIEGIDAYPDHEKLLVAYGLDDPFVLVRRAYGWRGAALAMDRGIPLGAIDPVIQEAALLTVAGLGEANVRLLKRAGIANVEDLARASPNVLYEALARANAKDPVRERAPSLLKVRIWVREARRLAW